ncbi:MAG: hypothetical protein F4Z01_06835 [Gammaproteobacteria bacterium]|nr:hypothetical protein [Gammaproteobacteria bacterium]
MTQKNLLIALITLIVAIGVFAQVYILFAVTQMANQMDKRFAEVNRRFNQIESRFNHIETRLDALNQNYIDHLAHHIGEGERKCEAECPLRLLRL